jgi:hypothetical protein
VDGWSFLEVCIKWGSVIGTVTSPHSVYQRYRSTPVREMASISIAKLPNMLWVSTSLYLTL